MADDPTAADEDRRVVLDPEEEEVVEDRRAASALVTHEVVRRQGLEELDRPTASLLWSGVSAGIAISVSLIGKAAVETAMPGAAWTPLLQALGYSLGFVVVVLGRMQLFTENTLTAVLPLVTHPTLRNLARTLRLWGIVLLANLLGTLAFAMFERFGGFSERTGAELVEVSRVLLDHDAASSFLGGVPAGLLLASVVWTLPNAGDAKVALIVLLTGLIDLAGFTHVVAGSAEMWVLLLHGEMGAAQAAGQFFLPALAGNVFGGSVLFALLAHAQVRGEIDC